MKQYFVAVYPNLNNKLAGLDNNSGCSYVADTLGESWITTDRKRISDWINVCNYKKEKTDKYYLHLGELNYNVNLLF